ncbi:phage tail tape measure protein [Hymenobacter sp. M29]|uniref:Phage tail tape measure protein n=1 Tax=Hymenobacter mellowenesis TaxID=3063995 RepID=A0ABT9AIS2_9BACT|nr:phage tail tape measure protein [Hymenobacter sp. M29]MDO7849244.1 phage tail tape measure protein [Hymenobacter sp. M29]
MADNKEQRVVEIILKAQEANASIKDMAAGAAVMTAQLKKMGADDPGRAALLADLQGLNGRLRTANQEIRAVAKSQEELAAETKAAADALAKQEQEAEAAAAAVEELARANEQAVTTGKKATASLTEMKTAASLMEKELASLSADNPKRAALQQDFAVLTQRITATNAAMRTVIKTEAELAEEQRQLAAAAEKLNQENIQVVVNGKKVAASYNEIQAAVNQLEKELKDLPTGTQEFIKKSQELQQVRERLGEVNEEMGQIPKNAILAALGLEGVTTASGLMKFAFKAAMEALLPLLAIQQIWEWAKAFVGVVEEVDKVRAAVNTATGAQGEMLETLTARTRALSATFGVEYADALKGVDVLAKQMGISHEQAFDLMEKGYVAGANRSEELLDNIKEYSVQFKAAGYSAAEMMEYLTKAELGGVFSDKGADVVKEFGLRIREQTVATSDAMDGAFGKKFTDRIFKGINDGSMTTKQALQEVSQAMNNTAIPASKLQTVVADVFGGPGEDAGTKYLQSLYKVGAGMDSLIDKTNDYTRLQLELLEANKWLATEQEELAVHFSGTGTALGNLWTTFKARLYADINNIVDGISQIGWVAEGSVAALKSWANSFVETFDRLASRDWSGAKQALSNLGRDGGNAYTAAYNAAMERAHQNRLAVEQARNKETRDAEKAAAEAAAKDQFEGEEKTRKEREAADKAAATTRLADAKKHAADLKKAREEAAKAELALQHSIEDLRVATIKDAHLRELAELDLQTQRKIDVLKGSEGQIAEQTSYLLLAKQAKIDELTAKWEEENAKKAEEEAQKRADRSAAADEEYLAYLENKVANGVLSEQAYQDAIYEVKRAALESQLALLVEAGNSETAEAKRVRAALLKGETEHTLGVKKTDEDLRKFKLAMAGQARSLLADSLNFLVDNLSQQSTAYGLFKQAMKALQIAEIGINLQGELAANAKAAAENPANGPTAGFAGISQLALANGLSIGRAILSTIKVSAFEKGGRTDSGLNQFTLASVASLLSGASGGSQVGSFAGGGVVPGAQIGLIGEAGAELVIPNWLFTDPKQANVMGYLEAQIASRGNAFADGGRTVERGAGVVSGPGVELSGGAVVELLQQLVHSHQDFRDEITTWQRELDANVDLFKVKKGLETIEKTQSGGGLK